MQDEISKHTKKIYKVVKAPGHSFKEKLQEIIIEILIIVFAVSLSIWFHGWSEERHDQAEVREFLRGLKSDLARDILQLEENRKTAVHIDSNFTFLTSLREKNIAEYDDKAISNHLYYDLRTSRPNIGRYDGFKSSGKIGNIEDDSLKQHILVYYQQAMPDLADGEALTNSMQSRLLDLQVARKDGLTNKEFVTGRQFQAWLELGDQNMQTNIVRYDDAIKQAHIIIKEIDQELK